MASLVYTVPELAAALNVSASTVRRMAKRGELPVLPIPGRIRFARAAIDKWIAQRTMDVAS